MNAERRRTDRILFTIPVVIRGSDSEGQPFEAPGRTITLNRHGARVQVSRPLQTGEVVHALNQDNEEEAVFRVVGPLSQPTERLGEWGLECLEPDRNIWGIYFPPRIESAAARALLECHTCRGQMLTPLSLVEVEVLETAGILLKPCGTCATSTHWGYAEKQFSADSPLLQALDAPRAQRSVPAADQRGSARDTLQLFARIRDFYGATEIVQTENHSKEGFCFTSAKTFQAGQGIMSACPYDTTGANLESPGHIVRATAVADSNRRLYAVRYNQAPS